MQPLRDGPLGWLHLRAQQAVQVLNNRTAEELQSDPKSLYALCTLVGKVCAAARDTHPQVRRMVDVDWPFLLDLRPRYLPAYDHTDLPGMVEAVRERFPVVVLRIEPHLSTNP